MFIRQREWEFGLAVQRCPRTCGSSPVGARRLGNQAAGGGPFPRGESVESTLGGYGLYYRTPLAECGIVAREGTLLGEEAIPIDVLRPTDRARALAEGFRTAVEHTAYYRHAMVSTGPIPADTIDELAAVSCLCRLTDRPAERAAIHAALFDVDGQPAQDETSPEIVGMRQRQSSVAHYLTLVRDDPAIVESEPAFREAMWSHPTILSPRHARVAGEWAGLMAKDVWQEALCSVWSQFCRDGLALTRELGRGLTWWETRRLSDSLASGPMAVSASRPTADLDGPITTGKVTMAIPGRPDQPVGSAPLESIREWTHVTDSAMSGLVTILELARRMGSRSGPGWQTSTHMASVWQPSVAAVVAGLQAHLAQDPTLGETMWWVVSHFVLPVHEHIAYSKLPEMTFRFRWVDGLLTFYDHGIGRFPLAAVRDEPLASLTRDLGFWADHPDTPATLTDSGRQFIDQVLR